MRTAATILIICAALASTHAATPLNGTASYPLGDSTPVECERAAATQARLQALADAWGTVYGDITATPKPLRSADVNGRWTGDTASQSAGVDMDCDGVISVRCSVSGTAEPYPDGRRDAVTITDADGVTTISVAAADKGDIALYLADSTGDAVIRLIPDTGFTDVIGAGEGTAADGIVSVTAGAPCQLNIATPADGSLYVIISDIHPSRLTPSMTAGAFDSAVTDARAGGGISVHGRRY